MHDIRAIRENPAAFDAALSRRGIDTSDWRAWAETKGVDIRH